MKQKVACDHLFQDYSTNLVQKITYWFCREFCLKLPDQSLWQPFDVLHYLLFQTGPNKHCFQHLHQLGLLPSIYLCFFVKCFVCFKILLFR